MLSPPLPLALDMSPCVCTRSVSPVLGTTVTVGDGRAVGRSCTFSISKISTHNNSLTVFKFN